jgi:hypothetical protein
VLLSNVYRIVKDISYLSLLGVEHTAINKEFVLDLDPLVLKRGEELSVRGSRSFNLIVNDFLVPSYEGVLC